MSDTAEIRRAKSARHLQRGFGEAQEAPRTVAGALVTTYVKPGVKNFNRKRVYQPVRIV